MTWIGGWTEEFGEFSLVAEEFVDRGEFVLARIRQVATGASSGIPIEREFWFLHQLPRRPHRPRRRAPLARARRERCGPVRLAAFDLAGAVGDAPIRRAPGGDARRSSIAAASSAAATTQQKPQPMLKTSYISSSATSPSSRISSKTGGTGSGSSIS